MEQIRIMILWFYAQKLNILQSKIIQEFWYRINYAGATLLTKSLQKGKITLVDPHHLRPSSKSSQKNILIVRVSGKHQYWFQHTEENRNIILPLCFSN